LGTEAWAIGRLVHALGRRDWKVEVTERGLNVRARLVNIVTREKWAFKGYRSKHQAITAMYDLAKQIEDGGWLPEQQLGTDEG
jgi:hypothetical protein